LTAEIKEQEEIVLNDDEGHSVPRTVGYRPLSQQVVRRQTTNL
jgi:hypothetical protein